LQLNPEPDLYEWSYTAGRVNVVVDFDAAMDTSASPATTSFEVKVDSVVRAVASTSWVAPNQLLLIGPPGAMPSVDVTLELLIEDSGLHALGGANVLPFGPVAVSPA